MRVLRGIELQEFLDEVSCVFGDGREGTLIERPISGLHVLQRFLIGFATKWRETGQTEISKIRDE